MRKGFISFLIMAMAIMPTSNGFAAIVAADAEYAPFYEGYICDTPASGEGQYWVNIGLKNADKARVRFNLDEEWAQQPVGTEEVEMISVISGSGMRYAGGKYEFHTKGNRGILSFSGESLKCEKLPNNGAGGADDTGNDAPPPADLGLQPVSGKSWGGKLRGGPGMNFEQVGSLYEGEPVTIIGTSGISMNGYNWFIIRTRGGKEAYQWGGLLCTHERRIAGLYEKCL